MKPREWKLKFEEAKALYLKELKRSNDLVSVEYHISELIEMGEQLNVAWKALKEIYLSKDFYREGQKFYRGDQIAYDPTLKGDFDSELTEYGFVTSGPTAEGYYFCRFWNNKTGELRTKSNSEPVLECFLVLANVYTEEKIEEALKEYC